MALLAMRSEDLPEMLSNARIFIDRGSPIFRVGIGSPMWIEGAEDGHSGNDQNSECCLDGYGEAKWAAPILPDTLGSYTATISSSN